MQYAKLGQAADAALIEYHADVVGGTYPSEEYSPYRIDDSELATLTQRLKQDGHSI